MHRTKQASVQSLSVAFPTWLRNLDQRMFSQPTLILLIVTGLVTFICEGRCRAEQAGTFRRVYAFGDSTLDAGNRLEKTGMPGWPYFQGRHSNGWTWADLLVMDMGFPPPEASLVGGTFYAYGGTPVFGESVFVQGLPSLEEQVKEVVGQDIVASDLAIVSSGSNSLLAGDDPILTATRLAGSIETLYDAGFRRVMVATVPGAFDGAGTLNEVLRGETRDLRQNLDGLHLEVFEFDQALSEIAASGRYNLNVIACVPCGNSDQVVPDDAEFLEDTTGIAFWDTLPHLTGEVQQEVAPFASNVANKVAPMTGDLNGDDIFTASDIDWLSNAINSGLNSPFLDIIR